MAVADLATAGATTEGSDSDHVRCLREKHVALSDEGTPWGQSGIDAAFGRVSKRAGVEGWSVYCLRHYAITSWLRTGIPVHVVQRMAGHTNLSTTQRYVHFLKADLEEAAKRLPEKCQIN